MGTEVLRPQDCLIGRIRSPPAVFCRRKNYPSVNRKQHVVRSERPERPEQKKRFVSSVNQSEALMSKRSTSSEDLRGMKSGLVMEKVTILRRGESLDSKMNCLPAAYKEERDLLGSDPEMADLRSKFDVYAGSAFAVSPSPSSLPLPSFSKKKNVAEAAVDDSATRDLRRLLRLD